MFRRKYLVEIGMVSNPPGGAVHGAMHQPVVAGAVNIVAGGRDGLVKVLVEHEDVDALWVVWLQGGLDCGPGPVDAAADEGPILFRHAVQVKNIWTPCGDWRHDRLNGRQLRAVKNAG